MRLHAVADPTPRHWHFSAGDVWLSVQADPGPPLTQVITQPHCAAVAALVLAQAASLMQALAAAGLSNAHDWRWDADQDPRHAARPSALARGHWQEAGVQAHLALPVARLRALAAPPPLAGLTWQTVAAECLLAAWQLDEAERRALEPGGLLLLPPPATSAAPTASQTAATSAAAAPAQLRARGEAPAASAGQGALHCELVARWDAPLPLPVVLGWAGWVPPAPARPAPCQLIDAAHPDTVLARGRLLPWGSGQAFRIESM